MTIPVDPILEAAELFYLRFRVKAASLGALPVVSASADGEEENERLLIEEHDDVMITEESEVERTGSGLRQRQTGAQKDKVKKKKESSKSTRRKSSERDSSGMVNILKASDIGSGSGAGSSFTSAVVPRSTLGEARSREKSKELRQDGGRKMYENMSVAPIRLLEVLQKMEAAEALAWSAKDAKKGR
jgi:hypothetical protein